MLEIQILLKSTSLSQTKLSKLETPKNAPLEITYHEEMKWNEGEEDACTK